MTRESIIPFPGGRIVSRTKDGHAHTTVQITGDELARELMSDYSPFVGHAPRAPTLQLQRTLWTMTRHDKTVTAAIYLTDVGRELRVHYGADVDNLLDSLLSRTGDAPLEVRAADLRSVLTAQGWTEV